jgi:hypothetical protein
VHQSAGCVRVIVLNGTDRRTDAHDDMSAPRPRRHRSLPAVLLVVVGGLVVASALAAGPWRVVLARDGHLLPVAPDGALVVVEPVDPGAAPADDRVLWGTPASGRFTVVDPRSREQFPPEGSPHRVRLVVPWVGEGLELLASPRPRNLLFGASTALLVGAAILGRRQLSSAG